MPKTAKKKDSKAVLVGYIKSLGYNPMHFIEGVEMVVGVVKSTGEKSAKIRHGLHTHWARELKRKSIGMELKSCPQYAYPDAVLTWLRYISGGPPKAEERLNVVRVNLSDFCMAMDMPKL